MASKSYRKFMATGLTAAVVASAVAPVASAATYTDVPAGSWFKGAVDYVSGKGYMTGTSATTFAPNKTMTRAEAATLFANKLDLYKAGQKAGYSDVAESAWYHNAVAAVKEGNIMGSTGDNQFSPTRDLTRGEVAALIVRAYGFEGTGKSTSFTDVSNSIFKNDIATLVELGIADGVTGTTFAPNKAVSRAEMAAFIQKADEAAANATPAVTSVSAINAKELVVKFNQPIKESSIIAQAGAVAPEVAGTLIDGVVKLNSGTSADGLTASLSADGKTLTITSSTTWSGSYSIELAKDKVVALNGKKVAAYKDFFTASDTTRASVTGVTYVDKFNYDVTFSEPVASTGTVTFSYTDGTSTPITATATPVSGGKSVRVSFDPATLVNKEITISLPEITDFAGNKSVPSYAKVSISNADQTKPVISSVTTTGYTGGNTTFQIKLSEAASETTVSGITVNGVNATATVDATDKTLINATVAGQIKGSALVYVPANAVTDLNGNKNAEVGQFFTFTQDEAKPTVAGQTIERIGGVEYLVLTFNENINLVAAPATLGFKYVDQYGMEQTTTLNPASVTTHNAVSGKTKQLKVSLDGLSDNKTYKVTFAAGLVTDGYSNASAEIKDVTFSTSTVDTGVGTDNVATVSVPATPGKITVNFNKPVNVASAQNVANYGVEGASVKSAVVTANSSAGSTVELTLNDDTVEATGYYNVTVNPIQTFNSLDTANKVTVASANLKENVRAVLSNTVLQSLSADALAVKLTFNDTTVADAAGSDFELYVNGTATGQKFTAGSFTSGVVTVSWTDPGTAVSDLTAATSIKLVPVSTLDIKDTTGNLVKLSDIVIK